MHTQPITINFWQGFAKRAAESPSETPDVMKGWLDEEAEETANRQAQSKRQQVRASPREISEGYYSQMSPVLF